MNQPIMQEAGIQTSPAGTILLLSAEEDTLSSLKRALESEEGTFLYCTSAHEALEILRNRPVDVIVTDLSLPEESGIEFLKRAMPLIEHSRRIIFSAPEAKDLVLTAIAEGLAEQHLAKPWRDTEVRQTIRGALRLQQGLQQHSLLPILHEFNSFQPPLVFQGRLQALLHPVEGVSVTEVVREIENHPALVAKLLQIANSVYFWVHRPVTSVHDAVTLIGMDYIRIIMMVVEYQQALRKHLTGAMARRAEQLWNQATHRSLIARRLSEAWEGIHDPPLASLTSLFVDIGYLVRLCTDSARYERMVALAQEERLSLYQADLLTFTISHDQVGGALLELWNFPREIVFAVANHHGDSFADPLTQLVQVADVLTLSDSSSPHDPSVNPPIEFWKEKFSAYAMRSSHGRVDV